MKQRRSPIPQKPFNPTFLKLPQLDNYEGTFDDEYWAHWEKKTYKDLEPFNSWVCPEKLERIAKELGYNGGVWGTMSEVVVEIAGLALSRWMALNVQEENNYSQSLRYE